MEIQTIVNRINTNLAGELLSYNELLPILDKTIDDINTQLNSCYPVFSEMPAGKTNYDYFNNKYIRSVVIPGATWTYLVIDEEGLPTAQQFQFDYQTGLFYMVRDMLYNIPEEYQADSEQGSVDFTITETVSTTDRGLYVDGNNFCL